MGHIRLEPNQAVVGLLNRPTIDRRMLLQVYKRQLSLSLSVTVIFMFTYLDKSYPEIREIREKREENIHSECNTEFILTM